MVFHKANWILLKIPCTWFFKADPYSLKMTINFFIYLWISKSATHMLSPELNYIQVKFGMNPSTSFEVTGQNVILSWWSIWNGNGNGSSWLVLHFQVLVDSIDLTWHHVAKSSHLAANVMTDRQTDTQTHIHRQTNQVMGENIIPFFKGIIRVLQFRFLPIRRAV